jgi:hypothetical protein
MTAPKIFSIVLAAFCLQVLCAEKISETEKKQYQAEITYDEIVKDASKYSDSKVFIKFLFNGVAEQTPKEYADLLPGSYKCISFEGELKSMPMVFSSKNKYLNEIIINLEKGTIIGAYCEINFKSSKNKASKTIAVEKKYYMKINDIGLGSEPKPEPGMEEESIDFSTFEKVKNIRLDIQYRNYVGKNIRSRFHFAGIGQTLPPNVVKFASKGDSDFFLVAPKERISLPIIAERNNEAIVSKLEELIEGDVIIVYSILRQADNPSLKNDAPVYFLELIKIEKE